MIRRVVLATLLLFAVPAMARAEPHTILPTRNETRTLACACVAAAPSCAIRTLRTLSGRTWTQPVALEKGKPRDLSALCWRSRGVANLGAGACCAASGKESDVRFFWGELRAADAQAEPAAPAGQRLLPVPQEPVIARNGAGQGTIPGATRPATFDLETPHLVTQIMTYHYEANKAPGTIALRHEDGTLSGPWPASGAVGRGHVANAYWFVTPHVVAKPGRYVIVDSDPATWSTEVTTAGAGLFTVWGRSMGPRNASLPVEGIPVAGTWITENGPVTLTAEMRHDGLHIRGFQQRLYGERRKIVDGHYDAPSRKLTLTYVQEWDQRSGTASFTVAPDGQSMTGIWNTVGARPALGKMAFLFRGDPPAVAEGRARNLPLSNVPRIEVLPVLFLPRDATWLTPYEIDVYAHLLLRHLELAQRTYKAQLGTDSFKIADEPVFVVRGLKADRAYLDALAKNHRGPAAGELMLQQIFQARQENRYANKIYLIVYARSKPRLRPGPWFGDGRPFNGGAGTGGGSVEVELEGGLSSIISGFQQEINHALQTLEPVQGPTGPAVKNLPYYRLVFGDPRLCDAGTLCVELGREVPAEWRLPVPEEIRRTVEPRGG